LTVRGVGPFLRDVWRLSWPYFSSEERWSARGLLLSMVVLRLAIVYATVLLNYWNGAFYNALQEKDWTAFIDLLLISHRGADGLQLGFTLIATVYVAVAILYSYVTKWLQIRWRRWLTERFIGRWTADRAYYRMSLMKDPAGFGSDHAWTDNPDQRIAEDLRDFVSNTTELSVSLVGNVVTIVSFVGILWRLSGEAEVFGVAIPGYLVWAALIYAIFGTALAHLVGRPLVALNFRQQRVEADFRYALVRVRENAEGIALHAGEAEERANLGGRFSRVVENWWRLMNRNLRFDIVSNYYLQVSGILPFVVGAGRYFAGKSTLGDLTQTVGAFARVQDAMSWIVNTYTSLAEWRAIVARLSTFQAAMDAAGAPVPGGFSHAAASPGLQGATIALPDGSPLLAGADLALRQGESVVLTGRAGSGKSTLFRALAGLWPFGSGGLRAPDGAMFLPQRAYVPLGTLRHAATYPAAPGAYPDAAVADALAAAGLGALVPLLDEDRNWPQLLSGGEQQRLALARALLAKPDWLFLDEATASLDPDGEAQLYRTLRERLPGTTIVSIAHRPSVAALHDRRVVFERPGDGPGRLVEDRPLAAE
jgi:putative ATP-binding cassette transporter